MLGIYNFGTTANYFLQRLLKLPCLISIIKYAFAKGPKVAELPNLISNRPRPLEVLRHLTPQTKLIDLQILIGIAFSHPFGPKLCRFNHLFCNHSRI